jgi:hypothetical protein
MSINGSKTVQSGSPGHIGLILQRFFSIKRALYPEFHPTAA